MKRARLIRHYVRQRIGETPQLALNLETNALQLIPFFAKAFRASQSPNGPCMNGTKRWGQATSTLREHSIFPSLAPVHVIHFELDIAPHPTRRLQRSSP